MAPVAATRSCGEFRVSEDADVDEISDADAEGLVDAGVEDGGCGIAAGCSLRRCWGGGLCSRCARHTRE